MDCYNCKNRYVAENEDGETITCHSICKYYAEKIAKLKKINAAKQKDNEIKSYIEWRTARSRKNAYRNSKNKNRYYD